MPPIGQQAQLTRKGLPKTLNPEGRPVWEPPLFSFDHLIGEEYEQKRKSVMKYTKNDVVRTTRIMDLRAESDILWMYTCYLNTAVVDSQNQALNDHDDSKSESVDFYEVLWKEVYSDFRELNQECCEDDVAQMRHEDGTWETTEVVWVTKTFVSAENEGEISVVDPYISAHNARLADAQNDVLPIAKILPPHDYNPALTGPTWNFEPLGVDIAVPEVMCMIYQGKFEAAYGGSGECSDGCNDDLENVD